MRRYLYRMQNIVLVLCIMTLSGCRAPIWIEEDREEGFEPISTESQTGQTEEEVPQDYVYVHVCGCVKKPGLYKLLSGERIDAAIRAAGGFTEKADEKSVNLAEVLIDGTQIEVQQKTSAKLQKQEESSSDSQKININQASLQQLMTLSGIGESRAKAIIAYREEHGAFSDSEDIKSVTGIGEAIYDKIKDDITI